MRPVGPRARGITRRAFGGMLVSTALASQTPKGQTFPSEISRFADPATEFPVFRLTTAEHSSCLPSPPRRSISKRGDFLVVLSDRGGTRQAYRVEQKSGEWRQLTEAENLDRDTVTLLPDERTLCYMDGDTLMLSRTGRDRAVYSVEDGWKHAGGMVVTDDGMSAMLVEQRGASSRLRIVSLARPAVRTLVEENGEIVDLLPRPRRAAIGYRKRNEPGIWLVTFDAAQRYKIQLPPGDIGDAIWSADGKTLLYLQIPSEKGKLITLREFSPDAHTDVAIAPTTQFATFSRNADSSVFVGASRSKASPHVLLLLRVTRRELTLAEHKASDAAMVAPVFSPSSDRVYFTSDREGKPCVYYMNVERFVEKTDS